MKAIKVEEYYNPILDILSLIKHEPVELHVSAMYTFANLLAKGGILCETYGEVMEFLRYLEEHKLITLTLQDDQTYLIENIYNG